MEFHLKSILKALLFSTSDSLSIKDIQTVITRFHKEASKIDLEQEFDPDEHPEQCLMKELMEQVPPLLTGTQIRDAMDAIAAELQESHDVCRLLSGPAGYRLTVAPDYAYWVRLMRDEPRPVKLSKAVLETLAIIAYRQPVTRAEMEAIRGVSADSAVSKLVELELVEVVGRADLPGRPLQYGTTDKFLEFSGIASISELPASDVLTPSQLNTWIREATEQSELPLTDHDMGLADEPEDRTEASGEASPTEKGVSVIA
jgi:segregation and condensation protein B